MKNVKLIVAYDGSCYLGWQEIISGSSIEATLRKALEKFLQHPVYLQAASRTDAGVHANGQVVNFFTSKTFDFHTFIVSLNALLPKDIVVRDVEVMPQQFHPTLSCLSKEYHYFVCFGILQFPQHRLHSWHYYYDLNLDKMREATHFLIGQHDFSAFCNLKKSQKYKDYQRNVESIKIDLVSHNRLCIQVKGENFLYKMVRNIVGTLVYVGHQKISPHQVRAILESKDRTIAGVTAPAHGLFLHQVNY